MIRLRCILVRLALLDIWEAGRLVFCIKVLGLVMVATLLGNDNDVGQRV